MKAEVVPASSWFEDDEALELEIRSSVERREPPPQIAGYEDLHEIGQGGQGIVYSATQVGTHRRVAVKLLRDRLAAAPEARRRFEREIDLAAGLRHPHIVAVFDGGTTPDGRPYLVMEFVEGDAIDACAAALAVREKPVRANLEALLRLFATICDAIQHAHQRGVIHRDVKPGNIRVDSDGVARVLDFGLAKVIGPDALAGVTATHGGAGRFIGSLPWSSPEQAAGKSDAIDVRSDVYSLGVVLFQLLTGHFPYDVSGDLNAALHNIVVTPPASPRRFVRDLDTDLVTITLRALAKEPDRRYQSAGELARDVRAFLAHEPIAARRDSLWYLVRITARRRRRTVALACVLLIALAASTIASLILWRSSDEALARAEKSKAEALDALAAANEAKDAAREALDMKNQALDLLLDSVFVVDPDVDGREARVLDGLVRAADQLDRRFENHPELRAWLHARFSELFDKLGQPSKALVEAEKAAELEKQLIVGPDDSKALAARAHAAFLRHKDGRSADAATDLAKILEQQKKSLGDDDIDALTTANFLGRTLIATGRYAEAEKVIVEARAVADRILSPNAVVPLELLEALAHARRQLGDPAAAETLQREAYERRSASYGADQYGTLNALSSLIVVLTERGKLAEAEPLQKGLYDRSLEKLGAEHPTTLTAANTYAKILQDLHRFDEAAPIMQATYDTRVRILGPEHKDTLLALANLATLRGYQKKFDEAVVLHKKALAARLKLLGPRHLETLVSYNNLAASLRDGGHVEEARRNYEEASDGALAALGAEHWITAVFRANLANTLTTLGKHSEAEAMLLSSQTVIDAKLGHDHPHAKTVRDYLATLREVKTRGSPESRKG